MGLYDWMRSVLLFEQMAPPPDKEKEEPRAVEPLGTPTEVEPMSKSDRKNPAAIVAASLRAAQERNRAARYEDFNAMDTSDISAMLDAVTDAALTFDDVTQGRGFKIECDDQGAEDILSLALARTGLQDMSEEILRTMLKYGDAFSEPVFYQNELWSVQTYQPNEITRNQNDKGKLIRGKDEAGFPIAFQQKKGGEVVAGWQPWEMTHFKLFPDKRLSYSRKSLLDDIRGDWRKLQLVEQGMVVARVTRAYPRRIHYVDMTGKDRAEQERTLTSYIYRMTNRVFGRKNTNSDGLPVADVGEDLYVATGYTTTPDGKQVPKLNRVETEDPAMAGLENLGDVTYLRQKVWSFVPADIVGIKRNTSGDLDSQDLAYARLLRRAQRQLEVGIRQILDQVLLAAGRMDVEYRVIFPVITVGAAWKHSDARFKDSMTLRNYLEMDVISRRYALKRSFNLSDREVEDVWQQIVDERNSGIFIPVLPNRNGQPSAAGSSDDFAKGKPSDPSLPSAPKTVPGMPNPDATTNSGISRGTKMSKIGRGNMSGG